MSGVSDGISNTFEDKSIDDSQIEIDDLDLDGYQAVFWYGILAISHATFALLWYLLGNHSAVIAGYKQIMMSMQIAYWPVAISWAGIALFDSEFSRQLYKATVSLSTLGPFAGNIIGFVFLWLNADVSNAWSRWWFWLMWPLFLVYDCGQMLLQYLMVPTVLDYVDSAALQTA